MKQIEITFIKVNWFLVPFIIFMIWAYSTNRINGWVFLALILSKVDVSSKYRFD